MSRNGDGAAHDWVADRRRLLADDGVLVHAEHVSPVRMSSSTTAFVLAHGFTQSGTQPKFRQVAAWLRSRGGVVMIDMRGHGRSGGLSTMGRDEIHDVTAGVRWARSLGYRRVASVGFSMGGAVVLRHAALVGSVDAVAAVSSPGQWFYRGTQNMRVLHHLVLSRPGRAALRIARGVRVSPTPWVAPYPLDPPAAAAAVTAPLLVVHGDSDHYFPAHHGWRIHAANSRSELWLEHGYGHAEGAMTEDLAHRIGDWLGDRVARGSP